MDCDCHLDPDRYWSKICKAVGIEKLQHDPRFNSIESRGQNAQELVAVLDQRFATKTRDEWMKILTETGCIFTPVQTPLEVSNDPQALANQYFIDVQASDVGQNEDGWLSLGLQRDSRRRYNGKPRPWDNTLKRFCQGLATERMLLPNSERRV